MSNLSPTSIRRGLGIRFYPPHPIRAKVWSRLWTEFLRLPVDVDRFQYVANRLGCDRLVVAAVLGDPDLIDLEEMSDLALAMGAEFDFAVTASAHDR